jgi:hypothetical protein
LDDVRWKTSDPEELIDLEKKLALEKKVVPERHVVPEKEVDHEERYITLLKEKLESEGFNTRGKDSQITDVFMNFLRMHFI